ncbi:hypothetical protein O7606_20235 [Micromonospora sp. WMMD882]|nr:hypothetical protein [Micromonospora sp. WMMD882]WBB82477.1 hypothetical protein O7606_20235 [Micromonospora sp. WMMD882]
MGDSWHADVEGALAAGMVPIWIARPPAATRPRPPSVPSYPTVTHAIRDLLRLLSSDAATQPQPADPARPAARVDRFPVTSEQPTTRQQP